MAAQPIDQNPKKNDVKDVDADKLNASNNSKFYDFVLWVFVALILVGVIGGNYFITKNYSQFFETNDLYSLLKGLVIVLLVVFALGVACLTNMGKSVLTFSKESYVEVRRVVWPTKQEARQTTIIIGVVASVVAIMLWFFDVIFMWLLSALDSI